MLLWRSSFVSASREEVLTPTNLEFVDFTQQKISHCRHAPRRDTVLGLIWCRLVWPTLFYNWLNEGISVNLKNKLTKNDCLILTRILLTIFLILWNFFNFLFNFSIKFTYFAIFIKVKIGMENQNPVLNNEFMRFSSHLDPYCDPCHDLVYGSNSSMIEGSFSIVSVLAHEQVIAEQRKTLMINMTRNRIPKAMHK